ncbi:Fic/DOC family protein [Peptostreptococcaceae bacterium AS15]|nr:Fic/DOC family protein [Peptostreptococcaceae bacterium AS15]
MYDYSGLYKQLKEKNLNKSDLTQKLNISSRTIAKISRGEKVSKTVLTKISNYFSCSNEDIYKIISDNVILQRLREEKNHKVSGGLYHELQIRMTYNSNHIEGSRLSEEQTRNIFETNTIDVGDGIDVDDIIETVNHFRAIDYCIDIAEELLTEEIIKKLHFLLKNSTKDERLSWFKVGEYKASPNVVGGKTTTAPKDVPKSMSELLRDYNKKKDISFEDIISFHYKFEKIHPFQDGNGRVGRLIAFKECLKNNIIPFIIEDAKKYFYYRGLDKFEEERGYLIDTCLDGQDTFTKLLEIFNIRLKS